MDSLKGKDPFLREKKIRKQSIGTMEIEQENMFFTYSQLIYGPNPREKICRLCAYPPLRHKVK